jgi:PTH1 family peptidyl-tRNA hydrolase
MNLSGEAVMLLMRQYAVPLSELVVIHDDLDLPLARLRLRRGGSAGGHRGVASIISSQGSDDFVRVRIGISRPEGDEGQPETAPHEVAGFVLGDFAREDIPVIEAAIDRAAEAVCCLLTDGLVPAMNRYN